MARAPVKFVPQRVIVHNGLMVVDLPLRVSSSANTRDHWRVVMKRKQQHRGLIRMALAVPIVTARLADYPAWRVTFTRIGPKALDTDNVAYACKSLRDSVAELLKVDDGDLARVQFEYKQLKVSQYGLRIEIVGMKERWAAWMPVC